MAEKRVSPTAIGDLEDQPLTKQPRVQDLTSPKRYLFIVHRSKRFIYTQGPTIVDPVHGPINVLEDIVTLFREEAAWLDAEESPLEVLDILNYLVNGKAWARPPRDLPRRLWHVSREALGHWIKVEDDSDFVTLQGPFEAVYQVQVNDPPELSEEDGSDMSTSGLISYDIWSDSLAEYTRQAEMMMTKKKELGNNAS
jgi:hypothetical protein